MFTCQTGQTCSKEAYNVGVQVTHVPLAMALDSFLFNVVNRIISFLHRAIEVYCEHTCIGGRPIARPSS